MFDSSVVARGAESTSAYGQHGDQSMKPATPNRMSQNRRLGHGAEVFLSADTDQVVHLLADGTVLRIPASHYRRLDLTGKGNGSWAARALRPMAIMGTLVRLAILAASLWHHR